MFVYFVHKLYFKGVEMMALRYHERFLPETLAIYEQGCAGSTICPKTAIYVPSFISFSTFLILLTTEPVSLNVDPSSKTYIL